ncbi:hypothetical protein HanLR1_Chr14g0532001 [Helianthus annuus]|nr:hypothetical protein HanHA89_Chr14g0569611 [Helianthus annuus]KAJ0656102.1 hypothetical protein HanLR1_Chr14g0532001 [Helianthus annuus]
MIHLRALQKSQSAYMIQIRDERGTSTEPVPVPKMPITKFAKTRYRYRYRSIRYGTGTGQYRYLKVKFGLLQYRTGTDTENAKKWVYMDPYREP